MRIRAGTSGWSYKEWKGHFYPEKLAAKDMLRYYAEHFATVEVNNTFYRMPNLTTLEAWAAEVPEDFSFVIKATKRITHDKRLKDVQDSVDYLLRTAGTLGSKLGPFLVQLPPNMKKDVPRLRAFLEMLPTDRRYTIEFRHETWFDDETYDALRARDIPMCIIEQPDFASPVVSTASWGYLRLHRFDYDGTMHASWAKTIADQAWSDAYVFFKHDEGVGSGPPAVEAFVAGLPPALKSS